MKHIKMHGPAQDGSGTQVNRNVPENDVMAYREAGYVDGFKNGLQTAEEYAESKPKAKADDEKHTDGTPKKTYTDEEAAEQAGKPKRGRKAKG